MSTVQPAIIPGLIDVFREMADGYYPDPTRFMPGSVTLDQARQLVERDQLDGFVEGATCGVFDEDVPWEIIDQLVTVYYVDVAIAFVNSWLKDECLRRRDEIWNTLDPHGEMADLRQMLDKAAFEAETEAVEAFAEKIDVRVHRVTKSRKKLLGQALWHWNCRRAERADRDQYHHEEADWDSDPEFLDRITVNYVRHELSNYDALMNIEGGLCLEMYKRKIRARVFDIIAATYPWLASECERQRGDDAD